MDRCSRSAPPGEGSHGRPRHLFIPRTEIAEGVGRLARDLDAGYRDRPAITFLVRLPSGLLLGADLLRAVSLEPHVEFFTVDAHTGPAGAGGLVRTQPSLPLLAGRHVVAVDVVVASTATAELVKRVALEQGAASVAHASFFGPGPAGASLECDCYDSGARLPERRVVGYGLGHEGRHRQLADFWCDA